MIYNLKGIIIIIVKYSAVNKRVRGQSPDTEFYHLLDPIFNQIALLLDQNQKLAQGRNTGSH